jgi:hypothetical protein
MFELFDGAFGLAFGVSVDEVVAAAVAVGLAGAGRVPDGDDDGVLDGAERLLVSAPGLGALVLRGGVGGLDADRGDGGLFGRVVQPLAAGAVLPGRRVPADWSVPGHWPAHDAGCRADAKADVSGPIWAGMDSAPRCWMPVLVHSGSTAASSAALGMSSMGLRPSFHSTTVVRND